MIQQHTLKQIREHLGRGVTAAEYIQTVLEKFGADAMPFLPQVLEEAENSIPIPYDENDDCLDMDIDDVLITAKYEAPLPEAKAFFAEDWLGRQSFVIQSALDNCPETLPSVVCDELGLPTGTTYADAVHELRVREVEPGCNNYITIAGNPYEDPHVSTAMRKAMDESRWFIARRKYSEDECDPTLDKLRQKRITSRALARIVEGAWCVRQVRFFPEKVEGICIESGADGYYLAVPEEEMQRVGR
jgi:hypothetical protein